MANKYADHSKAGQARAELRRKIHSKGHVQCLRKRRHASEQAAIQFAKEHDHPYTRAYRCPHCCGWHLTTH